MPYSRKDESLLNAIVDDVIDELFATTKFLPAKADNPRLPSHKPKTGGLDEDVLQALVDEAMDEMTCAPRSSKSSMRQIPAAVSAERKVCKARMREQDASKTELADIL